MPIVNSQLDRSKFEIWTPKNSGIILPQHDVDEHILRSYHDHLVRADFMESGMPGLPLGFVPNPEKFSHHEVDDWTFRISTLVIKEAGSNEYRLPSESKRFNATIKKFAEDQHARSPFAKYKYATLTARHYYVDTNRPQVSDEWHVDDTKEAELVVPRSEDYPISRLLSVQAYIASDHTGTQLQSRPVPGAMRIFNNKADERDRRLWDKFTRVASPYEMTIINNYVLHRPRRVAQAGLRNFVGLVYSSTRPVEDMLGSISQPLVFKSSLEF